MVERPRSPEQEKQTPRPNLLDVVKIDGRWAQVLFTGRHIEFLDDGSRTEVNWDDYRLIISFEGKGVRVCDIKEDLGEELSESEIEKIHWGPEEKEYPYLKTRVSVFGEYIKK
jgi:hypothetical protein